jgi:hypothetical protein
MAEITRETLLKNLEVHASSAEVRNNRAWQRIMQLFDVTTKRGERSICVSQEGEFTLDQMAYIKERAIKEGMTWVWDNRHNSDYDAAACIIITM